MAQDEKQWHQRFLKYMDEIVKNPNYKGLPIKKKTNGSYAWIVTAKSKIGQKRIDWCISKAQDLHFIVEHEAYPGMYADVMLEIHPTNVKYVKYVANRCLCTITILMPIFLNL